MRFRLRADGSVESSQLLAEEAHTGFELPKLDARVQWQRKHCIVYFSQTHSYAYDTDPRSRTAGPFGACAVAKRNICTGEARGLYVPNEYPGEVEFIPNPSGVEEDDGVLLGIVYNGHNS